jgi:hypothetical protein
VPAHFTADVGLLEDVHALPQLWRAVTQPTQQVRQYRLATKRFELRIQVVQCVTDLVYGAGLGPAELAVGSERILLEETVNGFARRYEVLVASGIAIPGGKDRALPVYIEILDDSQRCRTDGIQQRRVNDALHYCESVAFVVSLQ